MVSKPWTWFAKPWSWFAHNYMRSGIILWRGVARNEVVVHAFWRAHRRTVMTDILNILYPNEPPWIIRKWQMAWPSESSVSTFKCEGQGACSCRLYFVCKHGLVHAVRGVSCLLWPLVGRVTTYLSLAVAGDGGTARRVKVAIQCPFKFSFSKLMPSFLVHLLTQSFQYSGS
jgi:hypothetical protein